MLAQCQGCGGQIQKKNLETLLSTLHTAPIEHTAHSATCAMCMRAACVYNARVCSCMWHGAHCAFVASQPTYKLGHCPLNFTTHIVHHLCCTALKQALIVALIGMARTKQTARKAVGKGRGRFTFSKKSSRQNVPAGAPLAAHLHAQQHQKRRRFRPGEWAHSNLLQAQWPSVN